MYDEINQKNDLKIVTLMARFPFSPKSCAMVVSKMRQSFVAITLAIPS